VAAQAAGDVDGSPWLGEQGSELDGHER